MAHLIAQHAPVKQLNTTAYKKAAGICLLILTSLIAHPAAADADKEQGRILAYTCTGCHGIEGYHNAYPSFHVPKLGGQKSAYIVTALRAYRNGERNHPTMRAQGAGLSDQDIENVAAYLTSAGELQDQLATDDVAGIQVAALCVTCHGSAGAGAMPTPPTLAGQHEDYLVRALQQYKGGERSGNVMAGFAAGLSEAEIDMLAQLYASQDGLHTLSD